MANGITPGVLKEVKGILFIGFTQESDDAGSASDDPARPLCFPDSEEPEARLLELLDSRLKTQLQDVVLDLGNVHRVTPRVAALVAAVHERLEELGGLLRVMNAPALEEAVKASTFNGKATPVMDEAEALRSLADANFSVNVKDWPLEEGTELSVRFYTLPTLYSDSRFKKYLEVARLKSPCVFDLSLLVDASDVRQALDALKVAEARLNAPRIKVLLSPELLRLAVGRASSPSPG
ncbi:MAG: hypothetical protein EOO71_04395 [Myxococcaceae bacterium]|nr:MAG: hypothetical protein EOO71_04395 [Myxococcaceae bacterium]